MPQIPDSGLTPYCSPAELLNYYDARQLGDLVNDTNNQVSPSGLLTDPVIAEALAMASGTVEMACLMGERYEAADLYALTGNAAASLRKLVADIAYPMIRRRRGYLEDPPVQYIEAVATLELLRTGTIIWPFLESEQAGLNATRQRTLADDLNAGLLSAALPRIFGIRQAYKNSNYGGYYSYLP